MRLAIFGAGLVVSSSFCSRAAEVGSEVHAAVITSIAGAPTPAGTVTYMSVPLLSGVYAGGRISSITGNRVVDSSTNWTDGLYNGNAGRYYILITSGAALGWTAEITATLGSIHALDLAQAPPSTAQVGDSYRVRRYASVDSVFSDLNATTAQAAGNPSDADNLILYDATTKRSTSLFKSNVSGFDGWFDSAYSAGGTNILPPGTGWMLRRRATASAQLFGVGVVRSEGLSRTVQPGLNLLGTVHASDSPALSNLGLYTGSPTTGVRAGDTLATADRIMVVKPDGSQAQYYYSSAAGHTGWFDATGASADGVTFPVGSAFFLDRDLNGSAFAWLINP